MQKIFFITCFLGVFFNYIAAANDEVVFTGLVSCGEYLVAGVVRAPKEGIRVVVNEKTKSEYNISLSILDQARIAGLVNYTVTVNLLLDKKFDGTKGVASLITKQAEMRVPDPLNPARDTGFKLLKASECKKE